MSEPWSGAGVVETYTGVGLDLFDPDPADVRLADIAAGLAHTCRFGGHCRRFYSVAEHSLYVADELDDRDPRIQLYGLLHDAGEAYLVDVQRPIKAAFEGFEDAEAEILAAVWEAFGVPEPGEQDWATVMHADDRLLAYEADRLLADGSWAADPPDRSYDLGGRSPEAVRERFLDRTESLLDRV
jgi:hypothetical protein